MIIDYIEENIATHFNKQARRFGPSIDALQWFSEYSQYKRYEIIENALIKLSVLCEDKS